MALNDDMMNEKKDSNGNFNEYIENKVFDISKRVEKLEKYNINTEEKEKFIKDIVEKENKEFLNVFNDGIIKNNLKYNSLISKVDEKLEKSILSQNSKLSKDTEELFKRQDNFIRNSNELICQNNFNYEKIINESVKKNEEFFNTINDSIIKNNLKYESLISQTSKKLEDEILSQGIKFSIDKEELFKKYYELVNNLNNKLSSHTEYYKKEIDNLSDKLDENKEENIKLLDEEKEKINSIILEHNLKNFKEISSLRKDNKDFEESINSKLQETVNENNLKHNELINKLDAYTEDYKKEIDNISDKLDENKEENIKLLDEEKEKINSIILEHNLKNFKEISSLRKDNKDLKESINSKLNENNLKHDELVNKLDAYIEDYKKEIDNISDKLDENKEENIKLLDEEKEKINNIILEQNLKSFKELSSLRKDNKDFEESINSKLQETVNENNLKHNELINKLDAYTEDYKKEIDNISDRLDKNKEENIKLLDEEKEKINSIILEHNLKNFKEVSSLRKDNKDLKESINKLSNAGNYQLEGFAESINKKINVQSQNQEIKNDEFIKSLSELLEKNNMKYEQLIYAVNKKLQNNKHIDYNNDSVQYNKNDIKENIKYNKNISNIAILSVSIFAVILAVFFAYQLL